MRGVLVLDGEWRAKFVNSMCQRIHVTFTTKVGVSFMDHMTFWKLTCFFVPCKLHAIQHNGPTSQVVCECLLATEFSSQVLELLYPAIQILLVCWMITELASPLQYGCQLLLMIAVGKAPEVASTHSNGNLEAWMLVRLWCIFDPVWTNVIPLTFAHTP